MKTVRRMRLFVDYIQETEEYQVIPYYTHINHKPKTYYLTFEDAVAEAYIKDLHSRIRAENQARHHWYSIHKHVTTAKLYKRLRYLFNPMYFGGVQDA